MTNDAILDMTVREYMIRSGHALAATLKSGLNQRMPDVYSAVEIPDNGLSGGVHKIAMRLKVTAVSMSYYKLRPDL